MLVDLLEPVLNVVECLLVGAVVNEYYAHRAFVVGLSDRAESFLPSRVPHLQLDSLVLDIDLLYLEIDTYIRIGKCYALMQET